MDSMQDSLGIFAEINGRLQRENFTKPSPITLVVEVEEHRFILYSSAMPVQFIAKPRLTKDGRVKGMLDIPDVVLELDKQQLRECATRLHQSIEDLHWWLYTLPLRGVSVSGWTSLVTGYGAPPGVAKPVAYTCAAGAAVGAGVIIASAAPQMVATSALPPDPAALPEETPTSRSVWAALRELAE